MSRQRSEDVETELAEHVGTSDTACADKVLPTVEHSSPLTSCLTMPIVKSTPSRHVSSPAMLFVKPIPIISDILSESPAASIVSGDASRVIDPNYQSYSCPSLWETLQNSKHFGISNTGS